VVLLFELYAKLDGLVQVVELFEHYARDLKVDPSGWLPLLHASHNDPTESGVINSASKFTLSTIHKIQTSTQMFPMRFSLENKKSLIEKKMSNFHLKLQFYFPLFSFNGKWEKVRLLSYSIMVRTRGGLHLINEYLITFIHKGDFLIVKKRFNISWVLRVWDVGYEGVYRYWGV
jgi:hypothetical protein